MKVVVMLVAGLIGLFVLIWLGLQVNPKPFAMPNLPAGEVNTIPLPSDLPQPVERFYRTVYGNQIPVIDTVVITGRGRIRPFKIWLPARFVITHQAGRDYRHYFEATFFGLPFLKVQEGYINEESFFESPMGTYHNDANTNQGANLAVWAEGGWFPSLWITDPRVRWEAIDAYTALLFVPFEDGEESFVVRFNPQTGLVDLMEAMRFKKSGDTHKTLWLTNEVQTKGQPPVSYATWLDDGAPWAALTREEIVFNVDVREYIQQRGP